MAEPGAARRPRLTREQVSAVLGPVEDAKAAAVIATGASLKELEEAAAWAAGSSDVMGDLAMGDVARPASPVVAALYDILTAEDRYPDEPA